MAVFAVIYRYASDHDKLNLFRPEHREFLNSLHNSGKLLFSGPFEDDPNSGALLISRGETAHEVQDLLDHDPLWREEVIVERTIRPWKVVIGQLA